MSVIFYFLLASVFSAVLLIIWMAIIEPRRFRTWHISLPRISQRADGEMALPAGRFPEMRILHVTDTHFNGRDDLKLDFLRSVASGNPVHDFVFLTGDIMDTPDGLETCFELTNIFKPASGIYAVLGGHDFYRSCELLRKYLSVHKDKPEPSRRRVPNPVEELRRGLEERGVTVLEDENRLVRLPGGTEAAVVGLNDAFFFQCDYEKAWEGVGGRPTLVLAHSPDVLPEVIDRGAELAFFGHTHGGQVRLPRRGAVVTRSNLEASRARGIFREGETIFSINQGLGASRGIHIRFCCPPEVSVVHVSGEKFGENYFQWRSLAGAWQKRRCRRRKADIS